MGPYRLTDFFGPFLALCGAINVIVSLTAWIQCRFAFSRYLRKNHPTKWNELVYSDSYQGPNVFVFDKTTALYDFRTQSREDLGDPGLRAIRVRSNYLFRMALMLWLLTVAAFLVGIVIILIDKRPF